MSTKGVVAHSPKADLDKENPFIAQWRRTQQKSIDLNFCASLCATANARVTENQIKTVIF